MLNSSVFVKVQRGAEREGVRCSTRVCLSKTLQIQATPSREMQGERGLDAQLWYVPGCRENYRDRNM